MYSLDPTLQGYEENLSKFKGDTKSGLIIDLMKQEPKSNN
jgi:hypothetical protein